MLNFPLDVLMQLKIEGHALLDEYIVMDRKRNPKSARNHAYDKLAIKLNADSSFAHFANMTTMTQVIQANARLRKMIRKRKNKYLYHDKMKALNQYADPVKVKKELARLKMFSEPVVKMVDQVI